MAPVNDTEVKFSANYQNIFHLKTCSEHNNEFGITFPIEKKNLSFLSSRKNQLKETEEGVT